jgi:hypothetical protein
MKRSSLLALSFLVFVAARPGDSAELKLKFELSPAGSFEAVTSSVQGRVVGAKGQFKATDVVVQMGTLKTGIALRDKHLKERLKTAQYPTAKLSQITGADGEGSGLLEYGKFKKKIEFKYKIDEAKKLATAEFELEIPDFGIEGDIMYMGVGVESEVEGVITLPVSAQ